MYVKQFEELFYPTVQELILHQKKRTTGRSIIVNTLLCIPHPLTLLLKGRCQKGLLSGSGPKLFRAWCILGLGLVGVHVGLGLGLVVGVRLGFIYSNCRLGLGLGLGLGWKHRDSHVRIQYWQLQNLTCNYETVLEL